MPNILTISQHHIDKMKAHIEACLPEEGCGLLAGRGSTVELTILITNQFHSKVRYNMEPRELINAFYQIEEKGFEMLASFHSHPMGPAVPSKTDLDEFAYPGTSMLIFSKETGFWEVKGFKIEGGTYQEIDLRVISSRNL